MGAKAVVQFIDTSDDSLRARVCAQLSGAGLELTNEGRAGSGAVVLFGHRFGEEAVGAVRELSRQGARRVLVVCGGPGGSSAAAWDLLRAGAGDVLRWDPGSAELSARCVESKLRRWRHVDEKVESAEVRERMVGQSPTWIASLRELVEVAQATDAAVLVSGESGTGKELAARLIHELDPRPEKRELVLLDCTTIVPTLSGSEFFGHERGAFTGAVASRDGAFAEADGGTLFLDELAELPPGLQSELLRVIQEGMYKRVGSGIWKRTRFRLVCATNRDLREEVARGRFRADLFHRVAACTVRLPPLRDRRQDVPVLAEHFLRKLGGPEAASGFDASVMELLQRREYPGNVRELGQLVMRIGARHVGPGPITVGDLPPEERPQVQPSACDWRDGELAACVRRALAANATLREIRTATEELAIALALEQAGGHTRTASSQLGITDRALQLRRAASRRGDDEGELTVA